MKVSQRISWVKDAYSRMEVLIGLTREWCATSSLVLDEVDDLIVFPIPMILHQDYCTISGLQRSQ